jgi:hypothetical protein
MRLFLAVLGGSCARAVSSSSSSSAALLPYHHAHPGFLDASAFPSGDGTTFRKRAARLLREARAPALAAAADARALAGADGIINPTDYGADPTGAADASDAMDAAVGALCKLGGGRVDANGLKNLGGAVFDLSGGVYSISRTLLFPPGYSNFRVQRGTLLAGPAWPSQTWEYLLRIGSSNSTGCGTSGGASNKDCNSDVGVAQLTLDGSANNAAYGGLMIENTMDANVGPAVMVTNFHGVGISLRGSGAGYVHEAWLGQYSPGIKPPSGGAGMTATAILLDGPQHDCDVNNVIVYSGLVGVNSTNGANRIQGVHTWNLAGSRGGTGILLQKGTGRVQQSYLDYAPLVLRGHGEHTAGNIALIEGNFFLGSATIVLQATTPADALTGTVITGNSFNSWNAINTTFYLDERGGNAFAAVRDVVVENNEVSGALQKAGAKKSTRATMTAPVISCVPPVQAGECITNVTIDYSSVLVFGSAIGIDPFSVVCAIHSPGGPNAHGWPFAYSTALDAANHNAIVVTFGVNGFNPGLRANVTCSVDQSVRTCAAH